MGHRTKHRRGEQASYPGQAPAAPAGNVDPRWLQVHRDQPPPDVPFLPTDDNVVEAMLDFARVGEGDVLYDLGCGDGRICIAAAKRGARAVGIDIDLLRIRESFDNAKAAGVGHRTKFLRQSFFDADIADATVVALYLLPAVNVKLRPKLLWDLRPGTRVLANHFDIGDWRADMTFQIYYRTLYQWIVPAWVAGRWECVARLPGGGGRERMRLDLHRRYQTVWGTARIGRADAPLLDARLVGDRLTFSVFHPAFDGRKTRFDARYDGKHLRGTCHLSQNAGTAPWGGVRADDGSPADGPAGGRHDPPPPPRPG